MNNQNTMNPFTLTIPVSFEAHEIAEEHSQKHANLAKAKQVYLNTLAVLATEFYLKCLGLEPNWQASDSCDPFTQTLLDVADLWVNGYGSLECRPVLSGATFCPIPGEVRSDRIGYVVVQLSESLQEATLLGFAERVDSEKLFLSQLRSLVELPEYLHQLQPTTNLGNWLQGVFESGWQSLETLLSSPEAMSLAFRYKNGIGRWKQIDWEGDRDSVHLKMILEPKQTSEEMDITVEVLPIPGQAYLPSDLHILLLDEVETVMMEAKARDEK
ncbi:DUF1822 family protein [bacterium]|nr:DUF1822 family protein [bacterium]